MPEICPPGCLGKAAYRASHQTHSSCKTAPQRCSWKLPSAACWKKCECWKRYRCCRTLHRTNLFPPALSLYGPIQTRPHIWPASKGKWGPGSFMQVRQKGTIFLKPRGNKSVSLQWLIGTSFVCLGFPFPLENLRLFLPPLLLWVGESGRASLGQFSSIPALSVHFCTFFYSICWMVSCN